MVTEMVRLAGTAARSRSKIVARGIADERELEETDRAAQEHLDDPDTLVPAAPALPRLGAQ